MNYQSKKSHGFYNSDYKNLKKSNNPSFEKGYTKSSELEEDGVDFRFVVPWQMH